MFQTIFHYYVRLRQRKTSLNRLNKHMWKDEVDEIFLEMFNRLYAKFSGTGTRDNALHSLSNFVTQYKEAGECMKRFRFRAPTNISIQPDWLGNTCNILKSKQ